MLRDKRYDLIVHLNSSVDKSIPQYTLEKEVKYSSK